MASIYKRNTLLTDVGVAFLSPNIDTSFNKIDYQNYDVNSPTLSQVVDDLEELRDEIVRVLDSLHTELQSVESDTPITFVASQIRVHIKLIEGAVNSIDNDKLYALFANTPRVLNHYSRFDPATIAKMNVLGRTTEP